MSISSVILMLLTQITTEQHPVSLRLCVLPPFTITPVFAEEKLNRVFFLISASDAEAGQIHWLTVKQDRNQNNT